MTTIRNARNYDAPALAELCGQLGYPATRQQIVTRLAAIEADAVGRVLVAEDAEGRVVGWLHVAQHAHLVDDEVAEILGLVVAETLRGSGIGAGLLRAAEAWARERGVAQLRVRSRVERERAHRFYERAGYRRSKSQHVFAKALEQPG
jgi:N-acetylglutamate synthase-like GNAT family acetyltransferase